jgi:hypothetical protein
MCERHGELLSAYRQAVDMFGANLTALHVARSSGVAKAEYERLRTCMEETRLISEVARLDLERHVTEHGCGPVGSDVG